MISDLLNHINLIQLFQREYQKGYSTVTQLVSTVHKNIVTSYNSSQVDGILLHFSKAFDRVPHGSLIYNLEGGGLDPVIVK